MEANVKYRIVKKGKSYAIQRRYDSATIEIEEGYSNRLSKKKDYYTRKIKEISWHFILPIRDYKDDDDDIVQMGHMFNYHPVRLYKTKKAAQDDLKQHLWDTMVEPIDGQEEWKQVNKD